MILFTVDAVIREIELAGGEQSSRSACSRSVVANEEEVGLYRRAIR